MEELTKKRIKDIAGARVNFDVPMSRYTTFRAGGKAEAAYKAEDPDGLRQMIGMLVEAGIPYMVLGTGSNILVKNGGIEGVLIILGGVFGSIEYPGGKETRVLAGAGLRLGRLIDFCTGRGLSGMEFLSGIPGTLGGALAMNSGSGGSEMRDIVGEITILTKECEIDCRPGSGLRFRYRGLDLDPGDIILNASLNLAHDDPASIRERVISCISERKEKFPLNLPSAGSVFRNPDKGYAGKLIEEAGLKGKAIGGAMISRKHANFIVNTGNASASDISALMELARTRVKAKFDIELVPEIKIVGKE